MSRTRHLFTNIIYFSCGILLLVGCKTLNHNSMAAHKAPRYFQAQCQIFNQEFTLIKNFGTSHCLFFRDGSLVQLTRNTSRIERLSADGDLLWARDLNIHHQLHSSRDQSKILVLAEDLYPSMNPSFAGTTRYDRLLILDSRTGKTLAEYSLFRHRKDFLRLLAKKDIETPGQGQTYHLKYQFEFAHFNAFYEIPENPLAATQKAFAPGNFIVTSALEGVFILDKDLRQIIWHENLGSFFTANLHDAQVLPNGEILIYSNEGLRSPVITVDLVTTVNLYHPLTKGLKTLFLASEVLDPAYHYSKTQGGAQLLGEELLLNLNSSSKGNLILFVDNHGKIKQQNTLGQFNADGTPAAIQDVKEIEASSFLENNHL